MRIWRISNYADLSGEGGRRAAGRWHELGTPVVYLAESVALAMMEVIVHLEVDPEDFPDTYQLLGIEIPPSISIEETTLSDLDAHADGWKTNPLISRSYIKPWFTQQRSPLMKIPSVIVPHSFNFLMNPLHPDAKSVHISSVERTDYDKRLFGGAGSPTSGTKPGA